MFSQFIPAVFRSMNPQFGIPINETVLPGKAVIAFFGQREAYAAFEKDVMKNPTYGTSTGMVHFSGQRFVYAGVDKSLDISSVRSIGWAIAGGYTNRFYSNVTLPTWFAAGLPGALADTVLPRDEKSLRHGKESIASSIRRSGSLNAILDATNIDGEREPLAKLLVQFLIARDSVAATQYVRDLKSGQEPAVALQNNFGLTHETLAMEFGRALGVPNVRP